MFVNIDVNIFLPKEIERFHASNKSLSETIDDEPDSL